MKISSHAWGGPDVSPILKLVMDLAGKELGFELAYQRMMTTQERRVSRRI